MTQITVQDEIGKAHRFEEQLEELVVHRGQCPDEDRNILLIGYWSLLFDLHKGILVLLSNGLYGSAFALVRPVVEALVRGHLVLICSEEDLKKIREDDYRVNFATVGPTIDAAFGLSGLLTGFLDHAREALHSFTHAGVSQLGRRFNGHDLKPNYDEGEITEVIRSSTSAIWMITNLVTKHLGFNEEAKRAEELFLAWGTH